MNGYQPRGWMAKIGPRAIKDPMWRSYANAPTTAGSHHQACRWCSGTPVGGGESVFPLRLPQPREGSAMSPLNTTARTVLARVLLSQCQHSLRHGPPNLKAEAHETAGAARRLVREHRRDLHSSRRAHGFRNLKVPVLKLGGVHDADPS